MWLAEEDVNDVSEALLHSWPKDTSIVLLGAQEYLQAPRPGRQRARHRSRSVSLVSQDVATGLGTRYRLAQLGFSFGSYGWAIRTADLPDFVSTFLDPSLAKAARDPHLNLAIDNDWYPWAAKRGKTVRLLCPVVVGHRASWSLTQNSTQKALTNRECPQALLQPVATPFATAFMSNAETSPQTSPSTHGETHHTSTGASSVSAKTDENEPRTDVGRHERVSVMGRSSEAKSLNVTVPAAEDKRERMHVLILSARENFAKRQVIRATWLKQNRMWSEGGNAGSRRPWAHFLVGAQGCEIPLSERIAVDRAVGGYCTPRKEERSSILSILDRWFFGAAAAGKSSTSQNAWLVQREKEQQLTAALQQEEKMHDDMVLLPMVDVYHNSTLKMKLAFQWVTSQPQFSKTLQWIVKVDDDAYVRRFPLQRFLFPQKDDDFPTTGLDPASEKILLGLVWQQMPVQDDPTTSKWVEKNYPHSHYPPYLSGTAGEVFSWEFVQYVADHQAELFNYAGEDYAFGIWAAEQIPSVRVVSTVQKFDKGTKAQRWFQYQKNSCRDPEAVISGGLTAEQIRACAAEDDARKLLTGRRRKEAEDGATGSAS
ncbi:unnamed protein product [Amoebophrya sp. A120]|nr:unnamed protein product [Amoebophrya sp. A120]|eukprot:GSA120T00016732001.1